MKKLAVFILICVLNLLFPFNLVYAEETYEDIKGTSLQIIKNGKYYGLKDKETEKNIWNPCLKKLKIHEINGKTVVSAKYTGRFDVVYASDGSYSDFVGKYIDFNNKAQNIKFENYPQTGVIIYRHKRLYGLIDARENYIRILPPLFRNIEVPDNNSVIFNTLKVSFGEKKDIILFYDAGKMYSSLNDYYEKKEPFYKLPAHSQTYDLKESSVVKDGQMFVKYEGQDNNIMSSSPLYKSKGFKMFNKKKNRYKQIFQYIKIIETADKKTVYLVKQDGKYGVESENKEIIVPLTFINIFDTQDEALLKKIASAQIKTAKKRTLPDKIVSGLISTVYFTFFGVLALPFFILSLPLLGPLEFYATSEVMKGLHDEYEKYDAEF